MMFCGGRFTTKLMLQLGQHIDARLPCKFDVADEIGHVARISFPCTRQLQVTSADEVALAVGHLAHVSHPSSCVHMTGRTCTSFAQCRLALYAQFRLLNF